MIGILIVSHGAFGESLIHSASHVLGRRPVYLRQLGVTVHDDPEALLPVAEDLIRFLDQGQGVLVLTDIFGATPSMFFPKVPIRKNSSNIPSSSCFMIRCSASRRRAS